MSLENERELQKAELFTRLESAVLPEAASDGAIDFEAQAALFDGAIVQRVLEFLQNQAKDLIPPKETILEWVGQFIDDAFLQAPPLARLLKPAVKAAVLKAVAAAYDRFVTPTPIEV